MLKTGISFTIETVFSHASKIEFMRQANDLGYRVYLYFIATGSPIINIKRVEARADLGGHAVPAKKIAERYRRSIANLTNAIPLSHRTYVFDNSGRESQLVLEYTPEGRRETHSPTIPAWIPKLLD